MIWIWIVTAVALLCVASWLDKEERSELQDGSHTKTARVYDKRGKLLELKRMRKFVITDPDGVPFMTRWVILSTRWGELKLHHFHRSDADRDLHDHPWDFWSIILWGGYYEETTVETFHGLPRKSWTIRPLASCWPEPDRVQAWYGPGSLIHRKAEHAHRVVLANRMHVCHDTDCDRPGYRHEHVGPKGAWTLIWTEYPRRKWGFHTACGWQAWRDYLAKKFSKTPICE